jgi:hypothetical protein
VIKERVIVSLIYVSEKISENFNIIIFIANVLPKRNPGSGDSGFLLKGFKGRLLE